MKKKKEEGGPASLEETHYRTLLQEALRQHQPAPEHNVHPLAGVGRARGAPELGLHRPLTQRLAHGLHRLRPVPDGAVAVLVLDAAAEGPARLYEGEKFHFYSAQLRVRIALAQGVHSALSVPVRLAGQALHVLRGAAGVVAGRELPARQDELQLVRLQRRGLAPVLRALGCDGCQLGELLRSRESAAYDHARYAQSGKLGYSVEGHEVPQTEGVVVHAAAERIFLAAEPGTGAPVGAAAAVYRGHVALALSRSAERAVGRHAELGTAGPERRSPPRKARRAAAPATRPAAARPLCLRRCAGPAAPRQIRAAQAPPAAPPG